LISFEIEAAPAELRGRFSGQLAVVLSDVHLRRLRRIRLGMRGALVMHMGDQRGGLVHVQTDISTGGERSQRAKRGDKSKSTKHVTHGSNPFYINSSVFAAQTLDGLFQSRSNRRSSHNTYALISMNRGLLIHASMRSPAEESGLKSPHAVSGAHGHQERLVGGIHGMAA
jgi:hypothetical protein